MAVPRSLKNATVILYDTDGSNTVTLTLEDGDLSFTAPNPAEHVPDRGGPGTVIDGTHVDVSFSMTLQIASLLGAESIQKVVHGTAASWVFTKVTTGSGTFSGKSSGLQDAATAVKLFQMIVELADPAGGATEKLYFLDIVGALSGQEGMPSKLSLSGTCMGYSGANFWANVA